MTAVGERAAKPLQTGSRLAVLGVLIVLLTLLLDPASPITWLVNLAGVGATTWGAIRVLTWLTHLRGRRSLNEGAVAVFLMGATAAMTITTAQGPQDRGSSWLIGISAVGFAVLGLSMIATAFVDYHRERLLIINPPPPPPPDATSQSQPPGVLLLPHEVPILRLVLTLTTLCYTEIIVVSFLR
jgi:hypothetical protein